jgi:hypothetical protein
MTWKTMSLIGNLIEVLTADRRKRLKKMSMVELVTEMERIYLKARDQLPPHIRRCVEAKLTLIYARRRAGLEHCLDIWPSEPDPPDIDPLHDYGMDVKTAREIEERERRNPW